MSTTAAAWLAQHAGGVPPALQSLMETAVGDADRSAARALPDALADAAIACLQRAIAACDEREAALPLLAADALVTFACEAAAADAAALYGLCDMLTPERVAARTGPDDAAA